MQTNRDSEPGDAVLSQTVAAADEVALLERVAAGDAAARRWFFDEHAPRVWRLLYRITGEYDEAHDLTQETLLHGLRKLGTFERRGSVHGWLACIALNLARSEMRRRKRREDTLRVVHMPAHDTPAADPLLQARVHAAVDELNEDERTVLLMHDLEGYTHEEIGVALGIATGSSRARLSRARARLRDRLHDIHTENAP